VRTKIKFLILIFVGVILAPTNSLAAAAREWEPIRPRDYWIGSGLWAGALVAYTQIEQQSGNLGHANFLDDAGRSAFRFSSAGQRQDAEAWSNVALTLAVAWPVVVDPYLARQAGRISNINVQAFGLTAVLTGTTKALVGRERPFVRDCRRNPSSDASCSRIDREESLEGFYSGHPVYAFTGAGLTCLHHSELRLYGDYRDTVACGSAIGLAAVVAAMRVAADKHYVTDVSSGALIGFLAGYVFPKWLHKSQPVEETSAGLSYWLPMVADDTYGLTHLVYF
jgi:membrane-associated phospholipid phosphatase